MCNAYTVRPKADVGGLLRAVSDEIRKLGNPLVRRTGRGVVVVDGGDGVVPATMRWGFVRPFSRAINNARSENLTSEVWGDSWRLRRCLVPVSTFFEWQDSGRGRKQAFEFRRPDGDWLWVAGLWEEDERHGCCFATITTTPSPVVAAIHDRALAMVELGEGLEILRGGEHRFVPYPGPLVAEACESPLKMRRVDVAPEQGELF